MGTGISKRRKWIEFSIAIGAAMPLLKAGSARAATLYWDSDGLSTNGLTEGSGTWDLSTPLWAPQTAITSPNDDQAFVSGSDAVFGTGTTGAAGTVTLVGSIAANSITFANGKSPYVLTGGSFVTPTITANAAATINTALSSGTGLITKFGTAALTLGAAAVVSGNLSISSGLLRASSSSNFLATDVLFFNTAPATTTQLDQSGTTLTIGGLAGGAVSPFNSYIRDIITPTGTIILKNTAAYTFSGDINNVNLVVNSSATQTMNAAQATLNASQVTIAAGTLTLDGVNGLTRAGNNFISMTGLGTIEYTNSSTTTARTSAFTGVQGVAGEATILSLLPVGSANLNLNITTNIARSTGAAMNFVSTGGSNGTAGTNVITFNTNAVGSVGFVDQGHFYEGADYLYADTYSGTTKYARAAVYGTDAGFSIAGVSLMASTHNLVTSSILSQGTVTVNTIKFFGGGAVNLGLTGNVILTNAGLLRSGGGATTITNGAFLPTAASSADFVIRTDTVNDSFSISSVFSGNAGSTNALVKSGAGALTLSGTNVYSGATYVDNGVLSISRNTNIGLTTTGAGLILNGGTLQATSSIGLYGANATTNARSVTLGASGGTFDVTGSNALTVSGAIAETSAITPGSLTKTNTGTLVLLGTNTYSGGTSIAAGTVRTGTAGGSFGTGNVSVASAAQVEFGSTTNLAISDTGTLTIAGSGNNNIVLDAGAQESVAVLILGSTVFNTATTFTQANAQGYGSYFSFADSSGTFTVVPEPASVALLMLGGTALLGRRRRTVRKA